MRTFKVDNPEFYCFQIDGSEAVYRIPLMGSMNNKEARAFEETDGDYMKQVEWIRTYIGDIVDTLQVGVTSEIISEWASESKGQGASVGES